MKLNRKYSVDLFRVLASIAVVFIHTSANQIAHEQSNQIVYSNSFDFLSISVQLCRFAVPLFFVLSGYFWGLKVNSGADVLYITKQAATRIAVILLFWSFVYLLPYDLTSISTYGLLGPFKLAFWKLQSLVSNPLSLISQSTKTHLWFLISLLWAMLISTCVIRFLKKADLFLILISIALYMFGVLAKAYVDTPLGVHVFFNTRFGPFWSLIFFVTGYFISKFQPTTKWLYSGVLIIVFGYFIQFTELYYLVNNFSTNLLQEYVFGTYFLGLGYALLALSNHKFLNIESLAQIGKVSLGIYASHFIFVDVLKPFFTSNGYDLYIYPITVFTLSTCLTLWLSKSKFFRQFVM